MKRLSSIIMLAGICLAAVSCWEEDIPEAGAGRHQVENLKAVPGDEEVLLAWNAAEGWNPTDYIITYTGPGGKETICTDGRTEWTISNLVNGTDYVFTVQAVYGKLVSNGVEAKAKPSTSRFPVTVFEGVGTDATVDLTWEAPSIAVQSYTLSWWPENDEAAKGEASLEGNLTEYSVTDLENDIKYLFSITANYAKGPAEAKVIKVMPTMATPYFLDRDNIVAGQVITFTFNMEGYPYATDIRWTFPDGSVKKGEVITSTILVPGTQQVVLTVNLKGKDKSWNIEVNVREYLIYFNKWDSTSGGYNGFKGTCPVFSPDGKTVYIITFNGIAGLYAFDTESGDMKWKYIPEKNSGSYNPLTVNPVTGDIYYGTQTAGQFYAVTPEGSLKWTFTGAGSMQSTAPAVSADGSAVYVADKAGKLFSLNATSGAKNWEAAFSGAAAGLITKGEKVVVGAGKNLYFYNTADGTLRKSLAMTSAMVGITGFAVAADKKTVYLPVTAGLSSFDIDSETIIKDNFAFAGNNPYVPVVAPDGNVFVGCKDSWVYNVDKDLTTVNWSYQHVMSSATTNAFNFSHPCVDSENRYYITSGQEGNVNYIFDKDGKVIESWTYENGDLNQKQMAGNNLLGGILYSCFIGSGSANGYFVAKYVGGERAGGWSTSGGDICGSNCIK
ncbi:MAG: fibronectin type III domain-containing protein [Candidatus Cryptobacteroides sp.]